MEQSEGKKSDSSNIANKKSPLQKVGEFLKEARQARNLSVEDLSSSLRIGKEQLIALEEGNENSLPERVFIKGMVRRIAEKLNLDTSFIFKELNSNENNEPKYSPIIKKDNPKKIKSLNPFSMVILSGILGLLTSFLVLKYIEGRTSSGINSQNSQILLLDKNIFFKGYLYRHFYFS